jgi:hypothetical protein
VTGTNNSDRQTGNPAAVMSALQER